jgi:hypothetical protein
MWSVSQQSKDVGRLRIAICSHSCCWLTGLPQMVLSALARIELTGNLPASDRVRSILQSVERSDKSRQRPRDYSVVGGSGVGERFEAQSK